MDNETEIENAGPQSLNISIQISMCVVVVCIYLVGVYLHSKIISSSRKEKQVTWKLDVSNSFLLIVHYFNFIVMNGLTIFVKDLYLYTGSWFCYAYKIVAIYGNTYFSGHSLIIALMKYVIIVQHVKAGKFGEDNVKRIFFWINLIFPAYIIGMLTISRPDFLVILESVPPANRCLGKSDIYSGQNSNNTAIKLHSKN